jgi:hypothetical protein
MHLTHAIILLVLACASCDRAGKPVRTDGENICELHHHPLKRVSGYLPDPDVAVSPGYGGTEFRAQFGLQYPHIRPWTFSSVQQEGWNTVAALEVCEECERDYDQAFSAYVKTDEKAREEQYMEFMKTHARRGPQSNDSNKDAASDDTMEHLPSDLPPP